MQGRGTLVSSNSGSRWQSHLTTYRQAMSFDLFAGGTRLPAANDDALDVADPDMLVGRRPTTNVPSQALVLINSPDVNRWAR